jgi:hypothetical protein
MNKMISKPAGKQPEAKVPTDLNKALAADTIAKRNGTIARRDFISWIESAANAG